MYEVGFIGLGRMGWHMAKRIQSFHATGVWNRTTSKANLHAEECGTIAVERVEDFRCPIVFCCLPTSSEVFQIARQMPDNGGVKIMVDCTTGDYEVTREIGRYLRQNKRIELVDGPVSGGPTGAASGTLTSMFGGPSSEVKTAMEYTLFAKEKHHLGSLGAGHAVKAVNNIMNTAHFLIASEALLSLAAVGVNPESALAAINSSSGRSLQSEFRIPEEVFSGKFNYGFGLDLMRKDVSIARGILAPGLREKSILHAAAEKMEKCCISLEESGIPLDQLDYTEVVKVLEKQQSFTLGSKRRADLQRAS